MSLPAPTTAKHVLGPTLSPQQQQQLDAPLVALGQLCKGDLRILFHSFFSFLNRRTDFYCVHSQLDVDQGNKVKMGFKEGDAEKLLLAAFKQFPLRRMPPSNAPAASHNNARPSGEKLTRSPVKEEKKTTSGATGIDGESNTNDTLKTNKRTNGTAKDEPKTNKDSNSTSDHVSSKFPGTAEQMKDKVRYTEEGNQIPVGNGGSTQLYKWTQTLDEITIAMPLPPIPIEGEENSSEISRTRAKDLDVQIKHSSVSIAHKNVGSPSDNSHLLKGEFLDKIKTDESTWSIESNVLLVTLEKTSKRWWNRVLQDEKETIDIELVDKTHKISDYDEATQGMIRQILFDQRQERLGLPTSDDILDDKDEGARTNLATSAMVTQSNGEKLDIRKLPPGVEFIDKHNFPGGKR